MCAAEANQVAATAPAESPALWGVRVLLAAALARALRAGADRATIRRVFEELLLEETDQEGDAGV